MIKNILVTGVTGDIGSSLVKTLLNEGYHIIGTCRSIEKVSEDFQNNKAIDLYEIDLSDLSNIKSIMTKILMNYESICGFVSCAGIEITKPLQVTSIRDYKELFDINVFSNLEIIKVVTHPKFVADCGQSIVLISSISSLEGAAGKSIYAASKTGLTGIMKPLGAELLSRNIRINAISPGIINTKMANLLLDKLNQNQQNKLRESYPKGFVEINEVTETIMFLLSDKSSGIMSQEIVIDKGHSLK
jgi:NAD(P)-dependent dehydrogenase (short-subunit alcohol dehydrogenase family)